MQFIIKHQDKKRGSWVNLTGEFKGYHTRESVRKHYRDMIKPLVMPGRFGLFEREDRKSPWEFVKLL